LPRGVKTGTHVVAFTRLLEPGDGPHVGSERTGAAEQRGVTDDGDDAGGGLRADAVDGGEQVTDLMLAQFALDIVVELAQPAAQQIQILAGVTHLDAVGHALMLADRMPCSVDQRAGEIETDPVGACHSARRPGV